MAYLSIARKWRPQRFEEVVGQEVITRTLQNAVRFNRIHPAYIFSGPRGVGKTTLARIFAKALNCKKSESPTSEPCSLNENPCVSCVEIAESRSIDVLEFDAASNTQVEKVRDLIIEKIDTVPARDRYKIFIIDEVHMLSTSSFNALLKTLEEPPPRVLFLMATTELQRVPTTILSRCQKFQFQTIPIEKIFNKLKQIAEAEKIEITENALWEIARSGEGSMRDALTAFDQTISFAYAQTDGKTLIEIEDVMNALGRASSEILQRTIEAIAQNRPFEIISIVSEISNRGQNLSAFCNDLMVLIRNLLVAKFENAGSLTENAAFSLEELRRLGAPFTDRELIRLFHALSDIQFRLRQAKEPRYQLEVGLIKLLEIKRLTPIEDILERLEKLEKKLASSELDSSEEISEAKKKVESKLSRNEQPLTISSPIESLSPIEPPKPTEHSSSFAEHSFSPAERSFPKLDLTSTKSEFAKSTLSISTNSSDIFEHVESLQLDAELEEMLVFQNDDLKPIKNVRQIIAQLGEKQEIKAEATKKTKSQMKPPKNASKEEIEKWIAEHPVTRLLESRLRTKLESVELRKAK